MQGQLDIFGFWLLRKVDNSDMINAVAAIIPIFRPSVGCLNRFRGLISRVGRLAIVKAVLGVIAELPWCRSCVIPVSLLILFVERHLAVGGLGRLAEAHFG